MIPSDGWEALSWAFWLFAALAYAGSLCGCSPATTRASVAVAADATNALADVLEARRVATEARFRADLAAQCGVAPVQPCAQRVLEQYGPEAQRHNGLVLIQRSAADALERAAACVESGDRECAVEALSQASRDLARLREGVRP